MHLEHFEFFLPFALQINGHIFTVNWEKIGIAIEYVKTNGVTSVRKYNSSAQRAM